MLSVWTPVQVGGATCKWPLNQRLQNTNSLNALCREHRLSAGKSEVKRLSKKMNAVQIQRHRVNPRSWRPLSSFLWSSWAQVQLYWLFNWLGGFFKWPKYPKTRQKSHVVRSLAKFASRQIFLRLRLVLLPHFLYLPQVLGAIVQDDLTGMLFGTLQQDQNNQNTWGPYVLHLRKKRFEPISLPGKIVYMWLISGSDNGKSGKHWTRLLKCMGFSSPALGQGDKESRSSYPRRSKRPRSPKADSVMTYKSCHQGQHQP